MYSILYIFMILLVLACISCLLFHWRKKRIICKIRRMSLHDKYSRLDKLVHPLGYQYDIRQDIFTSTIDAWQRQFGYQAVYDRLAPYTGMIFDSLPVYFDYDGKTWLIEFWKGQYGINTGSEVGIYRADTIVPREKRDTTRFEAVPETEFLSMYTELRQEGRPLAEISGAHWWLTMFCMGHFADPKQLTLNVLIRFPNLEMRDAFLDALLELGYDPYSFDLRRSSVIFTFGTKVAFDTKVAFGTKVALGTKAASHTKEISISKAVKKIYRGYVQAKNRLFCRLYCYVTRPFCDTCDRLMYLYYYLPFAFRHMLKLRHYRSCRRKRNRPS